MSEETTVPEPHAALSETSNPTFSIVSVLRQRESIFKERVAALDLRIGLNMLGVEGRKLFIEYISTKRQQ